MCFYIVCAVSSICDPKLIVDTPIEMSRRSITGLTVSHAEQISMQKALKSQFLRTGKLNMISSKSRERLCWTNGYVFPSGTSNTGHVRFVSTTEARAIPAELHTTCI